MIAMPHYGDGSRGWERKRMVSHVSQPSVFMG